MATVTPKPLADGVLLGTTTAGGAAKLYTAPASTTAVIRTVTICNTDASARTVTLYVVPSGGSEGDASTIVKALSLAAGETLIDDTLRVLETGDFISAIADVGSKVSARVDGSEIT